MRSLKLIGSSLLIAAAAGLPGYASAAVTTFFGSDEGAMGVIPTPSNALTARSLFSAALASSMTESFEGSAIPVGATPTSASPLSLFSGMGSIYRNDGAPGFGRVEDRTVINTEETGRFNTSSAGAGKWWEASASFTMAFSSATQAIGFYGTDFGDFDGTLTLSFFSGTTLIDGDVLVPSVPGLNGSLLFFGYINDLAFDRVVFATTQANPNFPASYDVLGFDDVTIGMAQTGGPGPIPEPGTLALVALSLGLLAVRRRS